MTDTERTAHAYRWGDVPGDVRDARARRRAKNRGLVALLIATLATFFLTEAGGSILVRALEVGSDQPNGTEQAVALVTGSPARAQRVAQFQRVVGLPLAILGDEEGHEHTRYASALGARVLLVDDVSRTTEENAIFGSCMLKAAGVRSVYLFTDAVHGRRATAWFRWYGMTVTLATTPSTVPAPEAASKYLPSAAGLMRTYIALHELGGLVQFLFKQLFDSPVPCGQQLVR